MMIHVHTKTERQNVRQPSQCSLAQADDGREEIQIEREIQYDYFIIYKTKNKKCKNESNRKIYNEKRASKNHSQKRKIERIEKS